MISGCTTSTDKKEDAISYVEKKYNTICEYTKGAPRNMSYAGIHDIYIKCDDLNDVTQIGVAVGYGNTDTYKDDYLTQKYFSLAKQLLESYSHNKF
ncbi:MAG TPA: hypothetical protein GXZ95_00625 [Mollicutes bacterium]|nr:hypothetical protein [Mollicutes bacterium]